MTKRKSRHSSNSPKVSVLMPAYNAEKYISESIESILSQTFKDFEFIILDDCSTDNTWKIIQQYVKEDSRIRAFQNKKNLYIARTRNKLIKLARGKYIAWQDADDISVRLRLENQYCFLEKNQKVGIVGGFLEFFNEDGRLHIRKYAPDDNELRRTIFRYSPVAQPTAMIRKRCFTEFGDYDAKYPPAEDIDMSFRIGTKYRFANLQKVLLKYRESPSSATYKKLRKIEKDTIEIRMRYAKHPSYKTTLMDKVYNFLQYLSIFALPPRIKISLFNFFRNTRESD